MSEGSAFKVDTLDRHTVCVIIPMFNSLNTINRALNSLSIQTRLPDHVVVIDDGSIDECAQVVRKYFSPYKITLIQQENMGPAAARNAGIDMATEELLCFLDADDLWLPTKLERQLQLYGELKALGRNVGIIDCFQKDIYCDGAEAIINRVKNGFCFADFFQSNVINGTSSVLVPKEVIASIAKFDTEIRFSEDRWLWTQISYVYEVHTVPEVLYHRFIGKSNITSNPSRYYSHKIRFIEKFLDRYESKVSVNELDDFVLRNHIEFLRAFSRCGDYDNVVKSFGFMFDRSKRALWIEGGRPFFRFLHAFLMKIFR